MPSQGPPVAKEHAWLCSVPMLSPVFLFLGAEMGHRKVKLVGGLGKAGEPFRWALKGCWGWGSGSLSVRPVPSSPLEGLPTTVGGPPCHLSPRLGQGHSGAEWVLGQEDPVWGWSPLPVLGVDPLDFEAWPLGVPCLAGYKFPHEAGTLAATLPGAGLACGPRAALQTSRRHR